MSFRDEVIKEKEKKKSPEQLADEYFERLVQSSVYKIKDQIKREVKHNSTIVRLQVECGPRISVVFNSERANELVSVRKAFMSDKYVYELKPFGIQFCEEVERRCMAEGIIAKRYMALYHYVGKYHKKGTDSVKGYGQCCVGFDVEFRI